MVAVATLTVTVITVMLADITVMLAVITVILAAIMEACPTITQVIVIMDGDDYDQLKHEISKYSNYVYYIILL